jgi:hypothetical protein
MAWFAVRSFYRSSPRGRPRQRDTRFVPGVVAIEERIVLFQARNADGALRKATAEADRYASDAHKTNIYGQRVFVERIPYLESYQLFDEPANGVEVYSSIETTSRRESTNSILRRKLGNRSGADTAAMFIAGRITSELRSRFGDKI